MIPRPLDEILDLNRAVAKKMEDVFVRKGIPVVPSIGMLFTPCRDFRLIEAVLLANRKQ